MHLSEPALLECCGTPVAKCILHQTAVVHYISRAGFSPAKCLFDFKDAVLLYTSGGYRSLEFGVLVFCCFGFVSFFVFSVLFCFL